MEYTDTVYYTVHKTKKWIPFKSTKENVESRSGADKSLFLLQYLFQIEEKERSKVIILKY